VSCYTTIEPEPPISLNGDWRLWSCLVAMAASAFTFSPHSVEDARCSLRTETARLSEEAHIIAYFTHSVYSTRPRNSTVHISHCVLRITSAVSPGCQLSTTENDWKCAVYLCRGFMALRLHVYTLFFKGRRAVNVIRSIRDKLLNWFLLMARK